MAEGHDYCSVRRLTPTHGNRRQTLQLPCRATCEERSLRQRGHQITNKCQRRGQGLDGASRQKDISPPAGLGTNTCIQPGRSPRGGRRQLTQASGLPGVSPPFHPSARPLYQQRTRHARGLGAEDQASCRHDACSRESTFPPCRSDRYADRPCCRASFAGTVQNQRPMISAARTSGRLANT